MYPPAIPCETDTGNGWFCLRRSVLTKIRQMLAITHSQTSCLRPKRPVPSLSRFWAVSSCPGGSPWSCPTPAGAPVHVLRALRKCAHLLDTQVMITCAIGNTWFHSYFSHFCCVHSAFSAPGQSPSRMGISLPWLPQPMVESSPSPSYGSSGAFLSQWGRNSVHLSCWERPLISTLSTTVSLGSFCFFVPWSSRYLWN